MSSLKITEELDLDRLVYEGMVKLEITGGIPTWEIAPSVRHQRMVWRIQNSIKPLAGSDGSCECEQFADVFIRFADGSIKRPDISVFCTMPPLQDEVLTVLPQAVIEVISPGYEYKDVELNPPFYLAQGVEDVLIVEPRTGVVTHYRVAGVTTCNAPVTVSLLCGCECTVPV